MTTTVEDQPAPKATDRTPAWTLVIRYVDDNYEDADNVLADMRERDRVGRARYGVPLTAGNGRKQLVDAYQEALDLCVYLRAWLDENDIDPDGMHQPTRHAELGKTEQVVLIAFQDVIETLINLREVL